MKPRWRGAFLYPTVLVGLFLGLQGILGLAGVPLNQQPAIAAVPSLAALMLSLPWRLRRAWGEARPWRRLGVRASWPALLTSLLQGLLLAAALLLLIVVTLLVAGAQWEWQLTPPLLLNGLALGLGVGFTEELLFRGWLLGELTLLLGHGRALWLQALLFSLVHTRFDLPPAELLPLLGGLLLFGVVLAELRQRDHGVLWGAIGLHGGAVGGWFLLSQGLLDLSGTGPAWLLNTANPIGGLMGWAGLGLLLAVLRARPVNQCTAVASAARPDTGARRDS